MKTNISGHDWLIDSSLSLKELAESEDVSSSVQVGVQGQPTTFAPIPDSFSVGFSDLTTNRAFLTSVFGIDMFNTLTESFSLVFEKLLKLPESPSSEESVEPLSVLFAPSDAQLFENDELRIARSDFLADAVIDISHKTLFSSAKAFEMPLCGASSFTLESTLQPLVFTFDSTNLSAVEKLSIACDDRVDDSPIDSQGFDDFDLLGILGFGTHVELDLSVLDSEGSSGDFPVEVGGEIVGDFEWEFDSPEGRGDADFALLKEGLECVVVEADSGKLLLDWQSLHLFAFEHVACLVSGCADEATVQGREPLSDGSVGCTVELELVVGSRPEPILHDEVAGLVVDTNRLCDSLVIRQDQFDSSSHFIHYIKRLGYKNHYFNNKKEESTNCPTP